MGAPAQTYFCENGHIVDDCPHHDVTYFMGDLPPCPHCGSTHIRMVCEWHDPDYWDDGNMDKEVSHTPIRYEEKEITIRVPVYDVKWLFETDQKGDISCSVTPPNDSKEIGK